MSESGYYAWRRRKPNQRQKTDMVLLAHIRAGFSASRETYGSPRMAADLQAQGVDVGRHRGARLKFLKEYGFILSMSVKGNCYDNAMVETVFKTIKSGMIRKIIF